MIDRSIVTWADLHPADMLKTRLAMRTLLCSHYSARVAVYEKLIRNIMAEHDITPEKALQQIFDIIDATTATVAYMTLGLLVAAAVEIGEAATAAIASNLHESEAASHV